MTQEQINAQMNTEEAAQGTQEKAAVEGIEQKEEGGLGEGIVENTEAKEEEKTAEGQEEQKEDDKKEDTELFGKPENYEYSNVKLPENMQLDPAMTGKFNEYAGRLNLSQKGADDLMQMAVELTQQTQQQTIEAMGKLTEAKIEGYKTLLNTDTEVGGANLKESIATANIAYDAFFKDEDLRILIAEGGLNVHPKFIKALKAIGSQMKNDTIYSAGGGVSEKKERQDILYPSMAEK